MRHLELLELQGIDSYILWLWLSSREVPSDQCLLRELACEIASCQVIKAMRSHS